MHFNVYDVFYSQCSHQHISATIMAIFRMLLLLQQLGYNPHLDQMNKNKLN